MDKTTVFSILLEPAKTFLQNLPYLLMDKTAVFSILLEPAETFLQYPLVLMVISYYFLTFYFTTYGLVILGALLHLLMEETTVLSILLEPAKTFLQNLLPLLMDKTTIFSILQEPVKMFLQYPLVRTVMKKALMVISSYFLVFYFSTYGLVILGVLLPLLMNNTTVISILLEPVKTFLQYPLVLIISSYFLGFYFTTSGLIILGVLLEVTRRRNLNKMRTQFTSESSMDAAHKLFANMRYWLKSQEQCAAELDEIAKELDEMRKKVNVAKVVGCSIATAASAGSLIATVCTGGLAAPLLVASVAGGAGTVTTLIASFIEGLKSSDRFEKQMMILEKAEKEASEIKTSIEEMVKEIGRTGVTLEELEEMLMGRNSTDLSADKMVVLYHFLGALAHHYHSALQFECKEDSLWLLRALAESKSEMLHPLFNFLESINGEIHVPLQRKTGIDIERLIKNTCLNAIQRNVRKEASKMLQYGITKIIKLSAQTTVKKKAMKKGSEMVIREATKTAARTAVKNNVIKEGSKALTREVTKKAAQTAAKVSCGIGLAISLVELVDASLDLAKNKPTEASTQLRKKAKTIGENVWEIRSMLDSFRKIIEDLVMKRKKEAEEQREREAEEKRKREAEEQGKREAEEKRKREAEEQRKKEAEEKRKREAEEQRKREAEEKRKREAEEQRKREAEEQRKREAEEKRKREAEEQRKKDTKEKRPKTRTCQENAGAAMQGRNVLLLSFIILVVCWIPMSQLMLGNQVGQQTQIEKGVMNILSTANQGNMKSTTQDTTKPSDQPNLQLNSQEISEIERYQKFLRQHHARDKGNIYNKLMNQRNQKTQQSQLEKEVMNILSTANQGNMKSKTQDTRKSCDEADLQLNIQEISKIIVRFQKFLRQHHARDKGNICNKLMNERKIIDEKQNKCKVINTFIITDSKNSIKDVCDKGGEGYCENGKKFQISIKRFQVVTCTVKNENVAYPHCDYRQQESSRYIVVACENGLPVHYENGLLYWDSNEGIIP